MEKLVPECKEIKEVNSTYRTKHYESSDQLFLEKMMKVAEKQ